MRTIAGDNGSVSNASVTPQVLHAAGERLKANLDALGRRWPALADRLAGQGATGRFQVAELDGQPKVLVQGGQGWQLVGDPSAAAVGPGLPDQIEQRLRQGAVLAVGTLQAQALIQRLAGWTKPHHVGPEPVVHVWEGDEQLVRHLLSVADWRATIESRRLHWWVGSSAVQELIAYLEGDLRRQEPGVFLYCPAECTVAIEALSRRRGEALRHSAQRLSRHYSEGWLPEWALSSACSVSRPPRVLLVGERSTTYVRHSIAQARQAFERLGWRVRVAAEAADDHRLTPAFVAAEIEDFHPELLMQVNRLGASLGPAVPAELPTVCWLQDDMPLIRSRQGARLLFRREFVAVMGSGVGMIHRFGYRPEQLVCLPMGVAVEAPRPSPPEPGGPDVPIAFVSHHGWPVEQRLRQFLDGVGPMHRQDPARWDAFVGFAEALFAHVERTYEAGGVCYSRLDYDRLLQEFEQQRGVRIDPPSFRNLLVRELFLSAGGDRYRQQVLGLLADAGFELALYGEGWDRHPRFARFARGPVENGPALHAVYARSAINLQLTPFGNDHQRLWEGALAGGFFLMRRHPADATTPVGRRLLPILRSGRHASFERLLADEPLDAAQRYVIENFWWDALDGRPDLDDYALRLFERNLHPPSLAEQLGELYETLTFAGRDELIEKVRRFLASPAARRSAIERLQAAAARRTFEAQLPAMLAQVRQRLTAAPKA